MPAGDSMPTPVPPGKFPKRFESLDGLRGIAALAVVVGHVTHLEPLGAAAVLVFFVISGYCVTAAADSAIHAGVGFRTYMWRRIRRIYPPYLLSVAFFVATRLVRDWFARTSDAAPFAPDAVDWPLNATLTQWMYLLTHPAGWPHENPTLFVSVYWSLCYEEQFYVAVGLMAFLATAYRTSIGIGLTAISLLWISLFPTTCFGWFVEYWPMFAVGSLVYWRLCRCDSIRARLLTDLALCGIAMVAFLAARGLASASAQPEEGLWWEWNGSVAHRNAFGDLAIAAAFGLFLVRIRAVDAGYVRLRWLSTPLGWLGAISYSLYLTHNFNLRASAAAARTVSRATGLGEAGTSTDIVQIAVLVAIATIFYLAAERPFLNQPLQPRPRRP